MWRHFRVSSSNGNAGQANSISKNPGAAARVQTVPLPMDKLRKWLRKLKTPASRWGWATDRDLRRRLRTLERLPRLQHRLGVRFQDPSGTWSVKNLVGFSTNPVKRSKNRDVQISWNNYVSWFGFRCLDNATVEVRRGVGRKMVTVRAEKRRRGDPAGPLAEEMITVTARTRCDQAVDRRRKIRVVRRTADLLPAVIFRPINGPQQWTLIYLHGLGSSAFENYLDKPHYFVDGSTALKIVVPTAPLPEVSCFDGWWVKSQRKKQACGSLGSSCPRWRLQRFVSWYDYLSNHDGRREDAIDWKSLGATQRALHGLIQREAAELGGRPDRIVIGGKSQGCCTALDALLTYPRPLGGFVGVVGHLLGCSPVEPGGPQAQTPLHFFHEPEDTMMRWEWVQHGERRLREAGYTVYARHCLDLERNGHCVGGIEGTWVRSALRSICSSKRVC